MSEKKIGFIGFGQMATAICDGFIYGNVVAAGNMYACARNRERLAANTERRGINACAGAAEVVDAADIVIVAVTPEQLRPVLEPIADKLTDKLVISIAWACDCDFLEEILAPGTGHISTVPNTPIAVAEGIVITERRHTLTDVQLAAFTELFETVALIEYVDTASFLTGGTMAGCTTAFAAMFIEALGDAGVRWGLSRRTSYNIISKMIVGVGKLALESGEHPAAIKDRICSPGGTTIIGVEALEEKGLRHALQHAVNDIMDRQE